MKHKNLSAKDQEWLQQNYFCSLEACVKLLETLGCKWKKTTRYKKIGHRLNGEYPSYYYLIETTDGNTYSVVFQDTRDGFQFTSLQKIETIAEQQKRQAYAKKCGFWAKKYNVPFPQALKIGTDENNYREYRQCMDEAVKTIERFTQGKCKYYLHELECGRDRKTTALQELGVTWWGDAKYFDVEELINALKQNLNSGFLGTEHKVKIEDFMQKS